MSLPEPDPSTTVLVTGASAGIGVHLARGLAALGHNLVIVARRRERLDELAAELRDAHGVDVAVHTADLGDAGARGELVETVRSAGRAVVGVCNNAGFGSFGPFADLPLDREVEMVRLNVEALHELTGAFVPAMIRRGEGAVLNLGSTSAFQPLPNMATYAATKAFVVAFSEALHEELSGTGVSCTALSPGPVPTEFGQAAGIGERWNRMPQALHVSPRQVAHEAIDGMRRGRRSVVPGVHNRVSAYGGRVLPRTLLLPVVRRVGSMLRTREDDAGHHGD